MNSGLNVTGWVGNGMGDVGVGAEPRGSRAWSGIKVAASTPVPGWAGSCLCSSSGLNVQFVPLTTDLEGLKFRVNSWPFAVDFIYFVSTPSPGCPLAPPQGLSLDFSVPVAMESSALGCSGMLWDAPGCSGMLWDALEPHPCCLCLVSPLSFGVFPLLTSTEEEKKSPSPAPRARSLSFWKFSLFFIFYGFWCCHVLLSRDPRWEQGRCPQV